MAFADGSYGCQELAGKRLLATAGEGQRRRTKLGPSAVLFRPEKAEAKSAGTPFYADWCGLEKHWRGFQIPIHAVSGWARKSVPKHKGTIQQPCGL